MSNVVSIDMIQNAATTLGQLSKPSIVPCLHQGAPLPSYEMKQSPPSETTEEIAKLNSALKHLDPNSKRGAGSILSSDGQPAESYWLGVVWAMASLGWKSGKEIAREWSKRSDLYTDEGFDAAWEGYNPSHPNPIGIGSLYKLAMANGWNARQNLGADTTPTPQPTSPTRYKLLGGPEIYAIPPAKWKVKGLLPDRGLAAIYGQSGAGKSFLAIDLGAALADNKPWFGLRTAACQVVYVALEGESGYKSRVQAWEAANNRAIPSNFKFVMQPFNITNTQDVADLVAASSKSGLVIVDTLNRSAPTIDENSSKDMGAVIEGAKRLSDETEGLVILVHHKGKDGSKGARGHSSLFAALDGAIEVNRTQSGHDWSIAKSKDGEDGKSFPFKLVVHQIGKDTDGDEITSCTVQRDYGQLFTKPEPQGRVQKAALKEIKQAIGTSQLMGKAGCTSKCIKVDDAVTLVARTLTTTKPNQRRNRAKSLIDDLLARGYLGSGLEDDEGWLWLT